MSIGGGRAGRIEAPAGATGCGELPIPPERRGCRAARREARGRFRSSLVRTLLGRPLPAALALRSGGPERGPLQSRPPFRLEPQTLASRPRPLLGSSRRRATRAASSAARRSPSLDGPCRAAAGAASLVRVALEHLDLLEFALEHDGRKPVGQRASVDFRAGAVRARARSQTDGGLRPSSCAAGSP